MGLVIGLFTPFVMPAFDMLIAEDHRARGRVGQPVHVA
jgi:hypothetical protein